MKKRPIFALVLPTAAFIIYLGLLPLLPLSRSSTTAAWTLWHTLNAPAYPFLWLTEPITDAVGVNWGVNLFHAVEAVGTALLWLSIGVLIDRKRARSSSGEIEPQRRSRGWQLLTSLFITACAVFLVSFWYGLIKVQYPEVVGTSLAFTVMLGDTILAVWSVVLFFLCVRYFHAVTDTVENLFRSRPDASWKPYVLLALISMLLISDTAEMVWVTALGLIQVKYRTLAGWLILLVWSLQYSTMAAINALAYSLNSFNLLFVACGFLASMALVYWYPRLRSA